MEERLCVLMCLATSVLGGYYYPGGIGLGGGYGGFGGPLIGVGGYGGGIGLGRTGVVHGGAGIGYGGLGYGGVPFVGGGGGGLPIGHFGGYGGESLDKSVYSAGNKNLDDEQFEKAHGNQGQVTNHAQQGFNKGEVADKDVHGNSGYYNEQQGGKNLHSDEKVYHGAKNSNQEGVAKDESKAQKGHKKGHVIKGFKSSHQKDESSKTEEFYDEANDEASNSNYHKQEGSFAENSGSAFKGQHEDTKFNAQQAQKEGHFDKQHIVDNSKGQKGEFGEKQYAEKGTAYGLNNGIDQHSLLGHQESNKIYKQHHVPFY